MTPTAIADLISATHPVDPMATALEVVRLLHGQLQAQATRQASASDCPLLTSTGVIGAVCEHFGVSQGDLLGHGKQADKLRARKVCWMLMRELLGTSFAEIGRTFDRHHTTILAARLSRTNPDYVALRHQLQAQWRISRSTPPPALHPGSVEV